MEEIATASIGELRQNVLLRQLCGHTIGGFVPRGTEGVARGIGNVPAQVRRVEAACIDGIDDDVGARRAIDHFGSFGLQCRGDEAR